VLRVEAAGPPPQPQRRTPQNAATRAATRSVGSAPAPTIACGRP